METNQENEGFPSEFHIRLQKARKHAILTLIILGVTSCFLLYGILFSNQPVLHLAFFGAVILFLSYIKVSELQDLPKWPEKTRIVPYFERAVPGVDTFHSGHALARNCRYLDELAINEGFSPLSSFGFEDDYFGEEEAVREGRLWRFKSSEGLVTINGLIDHLDKLSHVDDIEAVKADLERLQRKFNEAQKLEVRFCFHLRIDFAYTGLEFDNRKGRYYPTWRDNNDTTTD